MASDQLSIDALNPYRVLDLTNERGLLCGQILADLGADVIAVEPPGGSTARRIGPFLHDKPDPNRSLFWWAFSRNKRSITLDLQSAEGRERLHQLVQTADLLIESFAPGELDHLGMGYETLAAINPRVVMVSITPFGSTGPKATWAATDLTAWAASGTLLLTGDEDRPPVRVPGSQAWLQAGAEAAAGALIALAARERDGVGQHVDISAQTAAMLATQCQILQAGWGEKPSGRVAGGAKVWGLVLRLVYPCRDGHVSVFFYFGNAAGPFTRRLMEWMHDEGFVDAATRDKDWIGFAAQLMSGQEPLSELARCIDAVDRFTRSHTKAELYERAMQRGLLITPVSTTADVAHSAQLAARAYWSTIPHPELGRTVTYPGPFAKFSATPIRYRRRPPLVGEHNDEVLGNLMSRTAANAQHGARTAALDDARLPAPGAVVAVGGGAAATTAADVPQAGARAVLPRSPGQPRGPRAALPLTGLKVLEFAWVIAAPMAVRSLADYGATVVHVESATHVDTARTGGPFKDAQPGPERSGLYGNINLGKLGLTLNLARPEARQVALRLAAWADIVVESYSPKAMRAWGLHYDALRAVNPGIIMLSSCLNGQTGPHATLAGYGTMGAQLAGFGELVGWPDRAPAGPFTAYTDSIAPKFTAAALLAALDHKRRTGQGQYIDFSQAEASVHFLGPAILDYMVHGRVQTRAGNASPEHAPHGVYPAQGADRWVAIACATEAQWQALCTATGNPEWQTDPRFATFTTRQANQEVLDAAIGAWSAARDVDAVEHTLQAVGVPVHRVSSSADAFADPQLIHRGHFVTVEHPELGSVPVEASRMRFSHTLAPVPTPAPTFGQHNDQVLREVLGLTDEEIADLAASGALE